MVEFQMRWHLKEEFRECSLPGVFLNPITKEATFCLNTQKSVIFPQCPAFQLKKKSRKNYLHTHMLMNYSLHTLFMGSINSLK